MQPYIRALQRLRPCYAHAWTSALQAYRCCLEVAQSGAHKTDQQARRLRAEHCGLDLLAVCTAGQRCGEQGSYLVQWSTWGTCLAATWSGCSQPLRQQHSHLLIQQPPTPTCVAPATVPLTGLCRKITAGRVLVTSQMVLALNLLAGHCSPVGQFRLITKTHVHDPQGITPL